MVGSALEQAVIRSLLAIVVERNKRQIDSRALAEALADCRVAQDADTCLSAIRNLEHSGFVNNGHGKLVNLSGSGLLLALATDLPDDVQQAIKDAIAAL